MKEQIKFKHDDLDHKLSKLESNAIAYIRHISQADVVKCGNACLTEIIRQYAITPPILRVDLIDADEKVIEQTDATWERTTGSTYHIFFMPVERDCTWLEELRSQKTDIDGYPLGFLEEKRSRIRIVISITPEDKDGELGNKLGIRTDAIEQYADSVTERIIKFNKALTGKITAELNKRKAALIKAEKESEKVGLPRIHNPEHEEKAVQTQKLIQRLGGHMTNVNPNPNDGKASVVKSFIVHGHDETCLLELKNYIQNTLKLEEPVILREQPGKGKTLMEKFERDAEEVDLIFVLLTPDDEIVEPNDPNDTKRQARPNVLFEMGYFLGKLGRESGKILLLHKGSTNLPTDILGIEYIDISNGIESAGEKIRRELGALKILP